MSIDWSKVGESAILIGPTALVSGYVGARIKAYLDRARPTLAVSSCHIATQRDLLSGRVTIDQPLALRLRESPWAHPLRGMVNASDLEMKIDSMKRAIKDARDTLDFLDKKIEQLPQLEDAPAERKRQFLDEITRDEVKIIDASFTGSLVRQEVEPPLPPDTELEKRERVVEYRESDEDRGGYDINLRLKWYHLCYRDKRDNTRLHPLAKAMSFFDIPYLTAILRHVKADIVQLAAQGDRLVADLEELLQKSRHLVVELSIVNRGRAAAVFTPWAVLRIFGAQVGHVPEIHLARSARLWKPDDPVQAIVQEKSLRKISEPLQEEERGFVLEGASTYNVTYHSVESITEIEKRIPNIQDILSLEIFMSQVAVKRADVAHDKKSWILSSNRRFGKHGEVFPEEEMELLRAKWK